MEELKDFEVIGRHHPVYMWLDPPSRRSVSLHTPFPNETEWRVEVIVHDEFGNPANSLCVLSCRGQCEECRRSFKAQSFATREEAVACALTHQRAIIAQREAPIADTQLGLFTPKDSQ